jgi:hypothetical protein
MRRRVFLAALCSAAAWPFAARPGERIPRLGYLSPAPADAGQAQFGGDSARLRPRGPRLQD